MLALAAAALVPLGCVEKDDFAMQCVSDAGLSMGELQQLMQQTEADACGLINALAPCDRQLIAALSGPPGSPCGVAAEIKGAGVLPAGLSLSDAVQQATLYCKNPGGDPYARARKPSPAEFIVARAVARHVAEMPAAVGETRAFCDRRQAALLQCLQSAGTSQQVMSSGQALMADVCQSVSVAAPCLKKLSSGGVDTCGAWGADPEIAEVSAVADALQTACSGGAAAVLREVVQDAPSSLGRYTLALLGLAALALGVWTHSGRAAAAEGRKEGYSEVSEETYGTV